MYFGPVRPALSHIAVLGNALPRRCGLATYTSHSVEALRAAYPDSTVDHYAMDDGTGIDYPADVVPIDANDVSAFVRTATAVERSGAQLLWIHHEFGIFGGPAGDHLLTLLDHIRIPIVVTLHTVLAEPDPDQRRVMEAIIRSAERLIVMGGTAASLLESVYQVSPQRIDVIPHGAPDRALEPTSLLKEKLGLALAPTVMTFGLLSPGKGIETAIESLPAVVERFPDLRYLIVGATHPALVRTEGERYRRTLETLARDLGMEDHVQFIDRFLEDDDLLDYLQAADIYLTPYLGRQQVTSGTLSYALAMGRPVVSTPYIHAEEALAGGIGTLVPFRDAEAISTALIELLSDEQGLAARSRRIWDAARTTIWQQNARAVMKSLTDARATSPATMRERSRAPSALQLNLDGIAAMTDDVGIIQHSLYGVPDRRHGYCIDDNARALKLVCEARIGDPATRLRLARTYAAFVEHAWDGTRMRFRNFMGYHREWLEVEGSEDSNGRAVWALGHVATIAQQSWLRQWANALFNASLPLLDALSSPRSLAFAMLGTAAMLRAEPSHQRSRSFLTASAAQLKQLVDQARRPGWSWFEIMLSYDNARLPQALIEASGVLKDRDMLQVGLSTLRWLIGKQQTPDGRFRPVGTESFGRPYAEPLPFDQQPLEAAATIEACLSAWRADPDPFWAEAALQASAWFDGENDLSLPLATPDGALCHDGLTPRGVNLNMGAESILALQQARHALTQLLGASEPAPQSLAAVG